MKESNKKNYEKPEKSEEEEEKEEEKEEDKEYVYEEDIKKIIDSNKFINNEELQNINKNLSNSLRNFKNQQEKEENKTPNISLNEILELNYDNIPYQLFIYIKNNKENKLAIELIPKEGHLPYSYRNILDVKSFYELSSIFMELKTIENIGKKIISLFNKKRAMIAKDKSEDMFYLILKITIIDEDKEILIPLSKNENIQVCTINYLLREAKEIKKDFIESKKNINDKVIKELNEIKEYKKNNDIYLDIINKIKIENEKAKEDEISEDEDDEKKDEDDIDENCVKRLAQIIMDQNEEYKRIEEKINKMNNDFNLLTSNFKTEISPKNIILNVDINHIKPYILIHFELENIGNCPLTCKYDDIYCELEGISPEIITFFNPAEKYIYSNQNIIPKQKINFCKKIIINNPSIDTKYDFFMNVYSLNHGKISDSPTKITIYIRKNEENEENFISFLHNEKINYDIKNKKIIFEYLEEDTKNIDNNKNMVDIGTGYKKMRIKIYKYLYDNKSGMAENNDEDKDKIDAFVVINKNDIDLLVKKINDKYKESKKIEKYKLKDVICTCAGDFPKICDLIENILYKKYFINK